MKRTAIVLILILALLFSAGGTLFAYLVSAQSLGFVTIRADGSIDPPTAPIQRSGNVYTATGDINEYLVLERNNTSLDGAGHSIHGVYGPLLVQVGSQWLVNGTTNMTITNVVINGDGIFFLSTQNSIFANNTLNNGRGIDCKGNGNIIANTTVNSGRGIGVTGNGNIISGNRLTNCNYTFVENNPPPYAIGVEGDNNVIFGNYISGTNGTAIILGISSYNTILGNMIANSKLGISAETRYTAGGAIGNLIYYNNFINNVENVRNEVVIGGPVPVSIWDKNAAGNYWSDYAGRDTNGDGIGDTPYVIDASNQDHYPLINPVDITKITSPSPNSSPTPSPTPAPTPSPTLNSINPISTPTASPSASASTTPSTTLTPSPSIPEFPSWTIPLLLSIMVAVTGLLVHHKKHKHN
jgi:hypothetical protein